MDEESEEDRVTGQEALGAAGRLVGYIALMIILIIAVSMAFGVLIAALVP